MIIVFFKKFYNLDIKFKFHIILYIGKLLIIFICNIYLKYYRKVLLKNFMI